VALKKNFLIEKRNVLNEIRANSMSLQELRFFSIYLAKINSRDISTRVVRFSLEEFRRIMDFGRLNVVQIQDTVDRLLCKVVGVPLKAGGYDRFQLFKKCRVSKDENEKWYIEIDAHDDALPLMFEFKEFYFTYELWNALRLKSSNQIRMYEILKQFEFAGERVITVDELRELLGISKNEYVRYGNLKTRVIDACQEALATYTDIKFIYEPTGSRGKAGKINALKFIISHNDSHIDQLSLAEFISQREMNGEPAADEPDPEGEGNYFKREIFPFMAEACDNEFKPAEIQILYNLVVRLIPFAQGKNRQLEMFDYLKRKYDELNWRATQTAIKNRLGYLRKIIEADLIPYNE